MLRRSFVIAARLVAVSTLVMLMASCEDEEKATPQVIFDGRMEGISGGNCPDTGELFRIGDPGNPSGNPPVASNPIKDGQAWQQGVVSVSCSVTPAGADEFNVNASVDLSGATGGFFKIDGRFKTTGEQVDVQASFSKRRSQATYVQPDRKCTVTYPQFGGVAAGRVWGIVTCPNVENPGAQTACEGIAEFRFENCVQ